MLECVLQYDRERVAGIYGVEVEDLDLDAVEPFLDKLDAWLDEHKSEVVKESEQ